MNKFAVLFKKYRLRAEFETLSQLGLALAEQGYVYEDSIYSHWQKGTRLPNREVIIKLILIFVERGALLSTHEANEILESAHQGYLTSFEKEKLGLADVRDIPFQVPCEIANFTGREEIIEKVSKELINRKIVLLHGSPGVGKTALAIHLGHLLKKTFSDGVLWYKVDSSNVMDILLSIAKIFGEDIGEIKDIEVRASIVRTLLAKKKILLIFDNVVNQDNLHLLLPNSPDTAVLFSSQETSLQLNTQYMSFSIGNFTSKEAQNLFKNIFGQSYVTKHTKIIKDLCDRLGYLPLALNIAANYIKQSGIYLSTYLKQLEKESIKLQELKYENKNLFRAINTVYSTLDEKTKSVLISLGVFEGKDFPLEGVSFINRTSLLETEKHLTILLNLSFIEQSKTTRYRIHPVIRTFAREKLEDKSLYLRAASFYEQLLTENQEKPSSKKLLSQEVDNIIYIFKKCYDLGYWDQIVTMWNPLEKFLSEINEVKKLRQLTSTIDTSITINNLQKVLSIFMILLLIFWILLYLSGLKTHTWNYIYNFSFAVPPLIGGLVGLSRAKEWGLFKTNIGNAIFYISGGLFFWGSGNMVWAYYNFFQDISVPYPSLADIGYILGYFFWIVGIIYLSRATRAKIDSSKKSIKLFSLFIPITVTIASYYFLLFGIDRSFDSLSPLRILFDLIYPTFDIIILTLAILIFGLSVNFFGGKYKLSIFAILAGFLFQYIGDFIFSYTTSQNTYFNGNLADLNFTIGLYLLTWGTLSFYLTPRK